MLSTPFAQTIVLDLKCQIPLFLQKQYFHEIVWIKITTFLNDVFQSYYDLFQVSTKLVMFI